ncbi:MAG: prolyl oligopeptidase family serine peptidase [Myxococcota bacterium]
MTCLALAACSSTAAQGLNEALRQNDVDVERLFAPPTASERAQAVNEWQHEPPRVAAVSVIFEEPLEAERRLLVIEYTASGERRYGAAVVPTGTHSVPLPAVVSLSGFGPPYETVVDPSAPRDPDFDVITLYPAFRGNTLVYEDQAWVSEGDRNDQCQGAADDALSLVEAASDVLLQLDSSRLAAAGGSRGGNVALALSVRDPRFKAAGSIAGPTTWLDERFLDVPNMAAVYELDFLRDLLEGRGTVEAARRRMLACSPVEFVERLSFVQHHHGSDDLAVPIEVADILETAWRERRGDGGLEVYRYDGEDHQFSKGSLPTVLERLDRFFREALGPET